MPVLRIQHYAKTGPSMQGETLVLDIVLPNGKQDTLQVGIGRYEKRPVFLMPRLGELGRYQSPSMQALLQAVSSAYAGVLPTPYSVEIPS